MTSQQQFQNRHSVSLEAVALLTAATLVAAFVALRYGALWGETDTNAFATAIRAVLVDAQLVPERGAYPNGYSFPALANILLQLAGISVASLQLFGGPLLAVWLVLPAWLAYRELTGSPRGATLATVIILIQPEFLFPILRGSHEKFTRGLMFLCIYLLLRSIYSQEQPRRFAAYLLAFYLSVYALITFNNLLATSFITALGLSLILGIVVRKLTGNNSSPGGAVHRRLFYATVIALLLAFLFTFYAYEPARHSILIIDSIINRLALLFLGTEQVAVNPYQTISTAWVSPLIYLTVSIANWLLLVASFVIWFLRTITWWRNHSWPTEPRHMVLWSLYTAFGFLGALSILVDLSGAIASNLQHRIFPTFAMIAAAFVAEWFLHHQNTKPLQHKLAYAVLGLTVALLSIVAVFKATNEPSLSNKWIFYTSAEFSALNWAQNIDPEATTWSSFDERLPAAIGICCGWESEGILLDSWDPDPGTRNFLVSDIIRARAQRMGVPLPIEGDSLRVYDNGSAGLYHLRPVTPFQR